MHFQSKKDLHCYSKAFQKHPGPALYFASKYAMMSKKNVIKDIYLHTYGSSEIRVLEWYEKTLYERGFQNVEDSYE